ncbi:hypothetical protein XENTR_v10021031 [Xenopus tropicalis]|uniref:Protein CXorf21 homolog n=1 Tax=Xenopus tropicalis TaxID=8364 RepID=A0A803JJP2_XENTR|nr:protein CXorf21 homolog [Xenopus tropicalis]KAE8584610.1 hypothetical protein XENTR_v10021031 [Xenopus tropicalis]|eukprot:XP_012824406.1 PREDICTED: uncharacterized protein CXorf21 homolog [Xenopus tropicalis]
MLAEAFISTIMYQEAKKGHEYNRSLVGHFENSYGSLSKRRTSKVPKASREVLNFVQDNHNFRSAEQLSPQLYGDLTGDASQSMSIPGSDQRSSNHLDLYTSWSSMYGSIYKNYPDLHIGGDHFLNKMDSGCILDLDTEYSDGPVLLSKDIASGSTTSLEILKKKSIISTVQNEESKEKSITLQSAPFSNSLLNGYMESKIQEVYKQFLEENPMVDSSLYTVMFSGFLINNVNQISKQISQEQNLDHAKAREALLHCLRSSSSKISSEFATPVLHISTLDGKKNRYIAKDNI